MHNYIGLNKKSNKEIVKDFLIDSTFLLRSKWGMAFMVLNLLFAIAVLYYCKALPFQCQ